MAPIMAESKAPAYSIVREGAFFQNMHYTYHRLGIMSNLITAARYETPSGDARLTRAHVIAALRQVVEAHPNLWVVGVQRPSVKRGKQRLHVAMLHQLDLDKCVEFVDDTEATPEYLEALHNEWHWMEDEPSGPLWRVYVLGGRDVAFVYHHLPCDGMSGMVFHRTFQRALNSFPIGGPTDTVDPIVSTDPAVAKDRLFPEALDLCPYKPSILLAIFEALTWIFIDLWYGKRILLTNITPPKRYLQSATAVATPEQRTVTELTTLRVPAKKMEVILSACRAHKTTFTALLEVVMGITFAVDLYPEATVGASGYAYYVLPYLPDAPKLEGIQKADGVISTLAAGSTHRHDLKTFRDAMFDGKTLNAEVAWKLAREYRQAMTKAMPGSSLKTWANCKLVGPDIDDFVGALGSIEQAFSRVCFISNTGAFVPGEGAEREGGWKVTDCQFSVATTNGYLGARGFKFSVAGVKGGPSVINLSCEKGVISRELAQKVLDLIMAKIDAML